MFNSIDEIAAYLNNDEIACLECGKKFKSLGNHLRKIHYITCDDYREKHGLPALTPLAGKHTRQLRSEIIKQAIESGNLNYEHLPRATEIARTIDKRKKTDVSKNEHRQLIAKLRPGDHGRLPPGAKRRDGRDADRAREYQRVYRAKKMDKK